ncbi:MAG: nitronate monooxygenase [Methylococcales bacterium]|jgi:NADH:quinone reductase (non-electrogenic)|nr:nitronate monooxygenase [Methylococcales bacterium]
MKTRITELFSIQHPIIQGGMQWVSKAELVAAVANAGALGFLTALTQPTPEDLRKEISKTQQLTSNPFGVNLTIMPTIKPVPYEEYAKVIIESGIKIVETAGRNPEPYMPTLKAAGIKVIHKCTSIRHAIKAEKVGCDAVSIDGFECAGHPGEDDIPGLILIPGTTQKLTIPVVASGGFGDARGLVAALALGADGINMGTRFLATEEAPVHHNIKQALVDADERQTTLIFRPLKNTARVFKNNVSIEVNQIEKQPKHSFSDIQHLVSGIKGRQALEQGEINEGVWTAGMIAGLINDIPSVEQLVSRITTEAENIIKNRLNNIIE